MNRSFRLALRSSRGLLLVLPLLTGCGSLSHFSDVSASPSVLPLISGNVHGGQQAVSSATIKLWSVNGSTLKGASSSLVPTTVTSDAFGNFTIPGTYTCATPGTLVYLTATGGNPGVGTNNAAIAMAAVAGTCGSLSGATFININELTTVAFIEALAPFMTDFSHVGADLTANPTLLAGVYASINAIVSSTTGQFVTQPSGTTAPTTLYNTLANIMASCINSAGNTGSTSNCFKLFGATSSSFTDVFAAFLYIAQNPTLSITNLFGLAGGVGAPFQPSLATAPVDFTVPMAVQIPNTAGSYIYNAYRLAIDGAQNVWVVGLASSTAYVYDNNENLLHTITLPGTVGNMVADPSGNIWFLTSSGLLSKYASDGTLVVGSVATYINNTYPNAYQMAFDSTGNLWMTAIVKNTALPCFQKWTSAAVSAFTPVCFATSLNPRGITLDAAGNAYMSALSPNVIFKVDNAGNVNTTAPFSAAGLPLQGNNLHYDPINNHIIVYGVNSFTALNPSGTVAVPTVSNITSLQSPASFALDGAGDIWYPNSYSNTYFSIGEISPTGTFLTPTSGFPTSGLIPTGINNPVAVAIDAYGNLWIVNYPIGNNAILGFLQKVPAVAVPKSQQYY